MIPRDHPPEPLRYAIVVGGGWIIDAGIAASMALAGIDARLAATAGLCAAGAASFVAQKAWVFRGTMHKGRRSMAAPKFAASIAALFAIRMTVLQIGAGTPAALAAAYGVSFVAGYAISKYFVFRHKS